MQYTSMLIFSLAIKSGPGHSNSQYWLTCLFMQPLLVRFNEYQWFPSYIRFYAACEEKSFFRSQVQQKCLHTSEGRK